MQNKTAGPLIPFLDGALPAALEMLRQMVGINSFTGNRDGVNRLAEKGRIRVAGPSVVAPRQVHTCV